MTPVLDLAIQVLAFVAVAVLTATTVRHFDQLMHQRRRLGAFDQQGQSLKSELIQGVQRKNSFLQWIESSSSISNSGERQKVRQQLSYAGFNHPYAPAWFIAIRFTLAIGLPVAFLFMQSMSAKPSGSMMMILMSLLLCGVGLFLPARVLEHRAATRRTEVEIEFPDALDLMVVCVEAGLSLDAAFVRVGQEVKESHPRIAEEFTRVSEELRAGRSHSDALRAMAERTNVPGTKSFVALVIQTESLGASIGQTLRSYATEMRQTRFLKAEEKAMRIPVLMTVPLVACILPVIFSALLLPAVIDVTRHLMPALAGHGGG